MYTGHIYNNEGLPLSGVRVSDGQNIATTDSEGRYSLAGWEHAHVISVQMLTRHHDDWYRYIDEDVVVYDFYISPYVSENECTFFHFSDTEIFIDGARPEGWVGGIKILCDEYKPDFIIHTGDICRRIGLEQHRYAMNSENMGVPVRYTLGNHDYVNDKYGEYTFERLYGPVWYSFELGKIHFVVLPIPRGEVPGIYKSDDRLVWLKNDLEAMSSDKRPIFLCHEPCNGFEYSCILQSEHRTVNLKKYNPLAWVFGHLHVDYIRETDGRFHIGTGRPDFGGIDGSPAGCRLIKVNKDQKLSTKIIYNKASNNLCEAERQVIAKNFCFTAPLYAEEKIFVSTFDDGCPSDCAIIALAKNGNTIWEYRTTSSVKWNIAYENGFIFAKDDFGIVHAISASDGKAIWTKKLTSEHMTTASGGLKVQDGRLYVATNERAFIINALNGEILLASEYSDISSSAAATVSPIPFGNKLLWGKHWRGLICFDGENGKTLWHNKDTIDFLAEPIVVGGSIYAPTRYKIAKLDENGNIVAESKSHSEKFFNTTSTPLYHSGKLFVPTAEQGLGVYDGETLELIKFISTSPSLIAAAPYNPIGEQTVFGKPIIDGESLIFTAADGNVYFCDAESYEVKRVVSIGHPILSGVTATDEGYYVCDFDGGLSFIGK